MKRKKIVALLLTAAMTASVLAGCGGSGDSGSSGGSDASGTADTGNNAAGTEDSASDGEVTDFSMFITMPGSEINSDNEIAQMIADKYGVKIKETWLTGQTAAEATGTLIASGEYPDLLDTDDMSQLVDAEALLPLDDYIDQYPEFKEKWYTEAEWEKFRQPDGHIYWINPFNNTKGESTTTTHNDEAFWIQARVLEWAGYPKIETMDDYFKVIEDYLAANPTMEDGTQNLAYTILCEDWRYFCLENAGQFLAGHPNDGSVLVDPESFTQTYDEYIAKLSTGRVLGMIDQWWDFAFTVNDVFKQQGLGAKGCNYVPLGLTTESGMENRWHTYNDTVNQASGLAISVDCKDPDKAFKFIVDCAMDQELHDLRFWGVEGVDYEVDENGLYYRTDEQRLNWADTSYQAAHRCQYSYFPQWGGTSDDGINANKPEEQPSEFQQDMAQPLKDCLAAYDADNYVDMIGSVVETNGPWFPMYSFSNNLTTETPGGVAWAKMTEVKHEWLPKVVMASDFESTWNDYMSAYAECKPEDFLSEMQAFLDTFK